MPSSEIEIVAPADGRGETRYFLLVCASVLALAVLLLSLINKTQTQALPELPHALSNLATQTSNAVEEISMLEDAGMIKAPYSVDTLPLPTFQGHSFKQRDEHCYTLFQGDHVFALAHHDGGWHARWTQSQQAVDCHASVTWHTLNQ